MKATYLLFCVFLIATPLLADTAESTSPATPQDMENAYTVAIERRTDEIMTRLALSDSAKAEKVRKLILAQYRALRARDESIEARLKAGGKDAAETAKERASMYESLSKPLHDKFLADLSAELKPEQVDLVKDRMTYGKVKFTYDAYCQIVPGLTDDEKKKILELLRQARDEAIDGGSVGQKSEIFQKYKDKINAYLDGQGHNTAKAIQDWDAKQAAAKKTQ
jgi:hypothetical protein